MIIRSVLLEDVASIRDLSLSILSEEPKIPIELYQETKDVNLWLKKFPYGKQGVFLVVEENKDILGFCYLVKPKYYVLEANIGIVIKKEFRKKGYGSQLLYGCLERAQNMEIRKVFADINKSNVKSLCFFRKHNFNEIKSFFKKEKDKSSEMTRYEFLIDY